MSPTAASNDILQLVISGIVTVSILHDWFRDIGGSTDFLLARPDVDADRLVVSGMSYGGAKTMVHASCDDRFAAAVPNSPVYSMATFIERGMPSFLRGSAEETAKLIEKLLYTGQALFAGSAWSHGFDSIVEWYDAGASGGGLRESTEQAESHLFRN